MQNMLAVDFRFLRAQLALFLHIDIEHAEMGQLFLYLCM